MSGGQDGLPENWVVAMLADVGKARMGKTILAKELVDSGLPVYSAGRENNPWGYVASSDLSFGRTVAVLSARGSIGFPKLPRIVPFVCTQTTIAVDFLHRTAAEFYAYWLATLDWEQLTSGGSIPMLTVGLLNEQTVPLPPLNEQKRIVSKIEALQARSDAAKEALDAIPPLLEKFRQSVLAAAFRGDLTKKWREAHPEVEPASKLLERIRAERRRRWEAANPKKKYVEPAPVDPSGLPALPEGWCWATVDELCTNIVDCLHRTPEYVQEGVPAIRTADVVPGRILLEQAFRVSDESYRSQVSRLEPVGGDVLYSREGERYGMAATVPEGTKLCLSQTMMMFRVAAGVVPDYFMWAMNSPWVYSLATRDVGGSTSPHVNIRSIRMFTLALAPLPEQQELGKVVQQSLAFADDVTAISSSISRQSSLLNQSILAKAFRGELVPQDPTDEPASALLERIRQAREESEATSPPRRRKGAGSR
jgi:type I restriction enzyme S subunit